MGHLECGAHLRLGWGDLECRQVRSLRHSEGRGGSAWFWGLCRACHLARDGTDGTAWGWDLVMGATQGSLDWGPCSKMGPEKGGAHISQGSHPLGVLNSGGRWCSSAGPGPSGCAW
jgi:hypothetical protein